MEMSTRMNRRDAVRWAKRAIHLPIGERWLIISVVAALLGATWALSVLLVAGLAAFAYVMTGRILRTFTWSGPTPESGVRLLCRQADSGPVLSLISLAIPETVRQRLWAARWAWGAPAARRFIELAVVTVVVLAFYPEATVVGFWWMAIVAFHHYDTLYRAMQDSDSPRWITWLGLGWDGRTLVVIVLAALGFVLVGLTWGAWFLGALFVVISSVQWLSVQSKEGR
jgi:hypothetical protein